MPSMYNELLVSSFCTWVLPYIHVSCIHAALKGLNQGKIGLNTTWLFLQKESKRYGFHKSQNNSLPNKTAKIVKTTSECLSRLREFPWIWRSWLTGKTTKVTRVLGQLLQPQCQQSIWSSGRMEHNKVSRVIHVTILLKVAKRIPSNQQKTVNMF